MADYPPTAIKDANKLRCFAAEIIAQLWKMGECEQLQLLQVQVNSSVDDLKEKDQIRRDLLAKHT